MNEKISVLIPMYNREKFIERALESILTQTYKNIQIIVYDDGSTDNSYGIVLNMMCNDDRIVCYKGEKNLGVGKARNILLDLCQTKYAIWQDSDDVSVYDRVEKQLQAMTKDQMVYATWANIKNKSIGTTRGYATLMFPVNKSIRFPEDMNFGAEDAVWRERMEKVYETTDVNEVLYYIDFHGDRIGTWKRRIHKNWGGKYNLDDVKNLSYEETIEKFKKES